MKEIATIFTILFMICAGVSTSIAQDDIDAEFDFDSDDFYTEFEEELEFSEELDGYDEDLIDLIMEMDDESYFDEEFDGDPDLDFWDLNAETEDEYVEDIADNGETNGLNDDTTISSQSGSLEVPKRYMSGSELIGFLESLGFNKSNCPPDAKAPQGSIKIWNLNGNLAHSSVVLPGNKQIEMGRKTQEDDPEKYESEILSAGIDPSPSTTGEYKLLGTWCPPAGSFVNMAFIKEMVGVDREYGTSTQWNCHGFSATLASKAVISNESIEANQWVVWYAEKIGWQPIYITTYSGYKEDVPSCSYAGGGLDCSVMLEKSFILGPYSSKEDATAAICGQLTNFRRLSGIYAGLPVADFGGDVHNIENIGCTFPS